MAPLKTIFPWLTNTKIQIHGVKSKGFKDSLQNLEALATAEAGRTSAFEATDPRIEADLRTN